MPVLRDSESPMSIGNAGLVLFAPYLPTFLKRIEAAGPIERWVPDSAGITTRSRAMHLLQYLVDERTDASKPTLILNRLLVGIDENMPIEPSIHPTTAELDICHSLLNALIGNWSALSASSPAALRATFLQRTGRVQRTENRSALTVERKTVDVIVDQIPWSFSTIRHRWMANALHVTW